MNRYRETDADNRVPFVESEKELPEIHASQYQPPAPVVPERRVCVSSHMHV
ncbi:hypothetical protein [Carbonactinospora thermoautotrophica]|uniref:hypothetical protein n=1 Tax=Carbonactinospora thermoautotrophica TaxID=1469144 RepID=UPI002270F993|nr:hypothetical protein [Carbonactinospora thermoautotrophica]